MAKVLPYQPFLCQELPVVYGNIDYQIFKDTLERINELLDLSGIEYKVIGHFVEETEKEEMSEKRISHVNYSGLSENRHRQIQKIAREALRCTIVKELTGESFRTLSARLADSALFQRFCGLICINVVHVPSKSTLERYTKMFPEHLLKECVTDIVEAASTPVSAETLMQKLLLEKEITTVDYYLDSTCVKANIHYPTDWVLLKDGTRTLMKAIKLIRKQGIKHRMASPNQYIKEMNKLSIKMTHARNAKESKKQRKKIFREMKKMIKKVIKLGKKYRNLLENRWEETQFSKKMTEQILLRMDNVIRKMPEAMRQAHERIIGGRKVKNADKILSLYEEDIHVMIRKKAEAMVEFGNKLLLGEQANGIIIDWKLYKDKIPGDPMLLIESLKRIKNTYGCYPENASSDRGFYSAKNIRFMEENEIDNYICPLSVHELKKRLLEEEFVMHQTRRAQTEARIGIFKNIFLGKPLRSKGFKNREQSVAWAVLTHNLWVIARLPRQQKIKKLKSA